MAIKNKTKYAILGVLSLAPGSGYDIKKFCDKSISHFWNENFGHIYPVLNQLEKEGLIKRNDASDEARRKVYCISQKGLEEFKKWLTQPVEYQPMRSELLLKISFANHVPYENTINLLENIKCDKLQKLSEYKEIEKSYVNDEKALQNEYYPYLLAPLRYGIVITEASINWCDETIKSIKKHCERSF